MKLLSLREAVDLDIATANDYYKRYVNGPLWEIFRLLGTSDMDVTSAEGAEIVLRDGRRILDFSSSIGVVGLGHNHPRILAAERLCHERKLIDAIKVAPSRMQAAFAHNLAQMLPDPLEHVFFTVSGAEAVEAGMKICEKFQGPKKRKFLAATGSYHGKTHGSLSVTTSGGFQRGFLRGILEENVIILPYGDLAALKKVIAEQAKDLIAFIVEPLQGQGLDIAPPGYLKEAARLCRESEVLTIFDEVKVGMGRTGTFCAFMAEDVVPDVVTLSKSLGGGKRAVGAMVTTPRVFERAYGNRKDCSLHTTTFGGLGESCAVGLEALNILVEEGLIEAAKEKGDYLLGRLHGLQAKHPGKITEIRGRGLLQGIRFDFQKSSIDKLLDTNKLGFFRTFDSLMIACVIRELYKRHGILCHFSVSDPDVLHLMPPLVVSREQLDVFVAAIDEILSRGLVSLFTQFVKGNFLGR